VVWKTVRITAIACLPLLVILLLVLRQPAQRLVLRAYFTNAMGLKERAAVRLAGVDIGSVTSVRARPELKEEPVEVVMVLNPPYELKIPSDATAELETAGVLGETFVEIDTRSANGPPIGPNSILKTKPTVTMSTEQVLQKVEEFVRGVTANCDSQTKAVCAPSKDESPSHTKADQSNTGTKK